MFVDGSGAEVKEKQTVRTIRDQAIELIRHEIEAGRTELIIPVSSVAGASDTHARLTALQSEPATSVAETSAPSVSSASFSSLQAHHDAICQCQNCPLGKTRNKFVYGVGSPKAKIIFIGEAPGADEDRIGEPFVGRAGQLLDKILAAIDLDRTTVYIANILKCRPPNNRDPLPDEMEQCFPYLKEQIRIIRPKLLCALGRISGQALLATSTPIGKLRGQWHSYEGVPLMVTYHPAALLRNPAWKKETWEDMQRLRARYDSLV